MHQCLWILILLINQMRINLRMGRSFFGFAHNMYPICLFLMFDRQPAFNKTIIVFEYSINVMELKFIQWKYFFFFGIAGPSEENNIESIIDTNKSIGDSSADACDISSQPSTAANQQAQLSIATVSTANIEGHQVRYHFKIIFLYFHVFSPKSIVFLTYPVRFHQFFSPFLIPTATSSTTQ